MQPKGCIVGVGTMGTHHLRVLSHMPEVEVVALVEPSDTRRAALASHYPRLDVLESLDDALERHDLDFACLAAPVARLPELTLRCIAAGVAVLVEKPMAPTAECAMQLVEAARIAGVLLGVGYVERCNPAVQALKERLDEGMLGQVHQLHARRLSPYPRRDSPVGVALDLATHDIDVMRYLTGSEITRVYAETVDQIHSPVTELLCSTLRFGDRATGLLEVNWITPTKIRQLHVTGTNGMFVVDYLLQDLFFFENPRASTEWDALQGVRGIGEGDMLRYALARREPLAVQWESFLSALRGGPSAHASGDDGVAALLAVQAIEEAGCSHEVVEMPKGVVTQSPRSA